MRRSDTRLRRRWVAGAVTLLGLTALLNAAPTSSAAPPNELRARPSVAKNMDGRLAGSVLRLHASTATSAGTLAHNFQVLGHANLGMRDTNGDVFVHGNFAYVGTWSDPCNGRGVKIIDVSDLRRPRMVATAAARRGTSAEDMVVRHVSTSFFHGDLLGVGIQRCGGNPALDNQTFGATFWDVTNPERPRPLGTIGIAHGGGGVHELDMVQRGRHVYALVATPFTEFFDPADGGDFRIIDVTDPRHPVQVGQWGAHAHGLIPGPFFGLGSFGASFDHSARASRDGTKAYVSYWDLGVLTLDISDVHHPRLIGRTRLPADSDGDAHSVSVLQGARRRFLLENDEDFDPRSPGHIRYGAHGVGIENESPGGAPLWLQPNHQVAAPVVMAQLQGCTPADYPAGAAGKIVVVRTRFPEFDPNPGPNPRCRMGRQDLAAEQVGAAAIVHLFISTATSPQFFDAEPVSIPVLYTDAATARGMVKAGSARLIADPPSWGFLRVFDARTGRQVAKFDRLPHVHEVRPPNGAWAIHNNEVLGDHSYASWYSNGIVALDLSPLNRPDAGNPRMVGQFVPPGAPSQSPAIPSGIAVVWGVAVRESDGVIFASDMNSGLWIIRPTGPAAVH